MDIEQSWNLLDAPEQMALVRLSIFCGEFDRVAAQSVADCSLAQIISLLERSLLRCGLMGSLCETLESAPGQYGLAPGVRQFIAQQQAVETQVETSLRQRHAQWFANLSDRIYPDMRGAMQPQAYVLFAGMVEDVRAAWDWAVAEQDGELLLKIPAVLVHYHNTHGKFVLSLELLQPVMAFLQENALFCSAQLSAHLICLYGETLVEMDRYSEAQSWVERGLALARQMDGRGQLTSFLNLRARILWVQGDTGGALETWQEMQSLAKQTDDRHAYLEALTGIGKVYWARGDHPAALECFQESLRVAQELQAAINIGLAHDYLGVVHREMRDYETSRQYLVAGVAILREAGARVRLAYALNHLAGVLGYLGELDQEMQSFAESLTLARETGERRLEAYTLSDMSDTLSSSGELSRAFDLKQKAYAVFQEVGDYLGQVVSLTGLAQVRLKFFENRAGDPEKLAEAKVFIRKALEMAVSGKILMHIASSLLIGVRTLYRSGLVVQAIQALAALEKILEGKESGEEMSLLEEVGEEFILLAGGLPPSVVEAARQMGAGYSTAEDVARLIVDNLQ